MTADDDITTRLRRACDWFDGDTTHINVLLREAADYIDFLIALDERAEMVISASRQFKGRARSLDVALDTWDTKKVVLKDAYFEARRSTSQHLSALPTERGKE